MMKKTFIKLLMAVALVGTMASCSDDDKTTPKVNIEESSVTVDISQAKWCSTGRLQRTQTSIILRWLTTTRLRVTVCSTPAPMPTLS